MTEDNSPLAPYMPDPTWAPMALDILERVLQASESMTTLAEFICSEFRELLGARTVMLIRYSGSQEEPERQLLAANPLRRASWWEDPYLHSFVDTAMKQETDASMVYSDSDLLQGSTPPGNLGLCLAMPLQVSGVRNACILASGIPVKNRLQTLRDAIDPILRTIAIVIENAFLRDYQETVLADQTSSLSRQLAIGRIVAEISGGIAGLGSLEQKVGRALGTVGDFLDADRAFIFLIRPAGALIDNTHEWCAEGIEPQSHRLQGLVPEQELPWFWAEMQAGRAVRVPRVSALPPEAELEKRHWQEQDIISLLAVPIIGAEGMIGFIGLDYTKSAQSWRDDTVNLLRITGEAAGGAIRAEQAEDGRREAEAQLRASQKLESIGTLAGGVAHDFNNLLMGIMNYVELCRDVTEPEHAVRGWLDEIETEAQRSADLTRQLLAFARKQPVTPRILDLNDQVPTTLKMLRRLIGEGIELAWVPGAGICRVKIDPTQVDQILTNLCVNARDAIGGTGKITIETSTASLDANYCAKHAELEPGVYAVLAVGDNGCGMDSSTRERLFDPFFTTKAMGKGTGMGLSTLYGIVSQNKGHVRVHSELGHGSTFRVYLPRYEAAMEPETISEPARDRPRGGNETLMLVEDEKSIRVTTTIFLERAGYTVLTAESPETALSMASDNEFCIDLLITDIVMPGMSGLDLSTIMKEDRPALKCLYVSGYTADVIAHHGIIEEGVEFLSKPINRDVLLLKVRAMLDEPRQ